MLESIYNIGGGKQSSPLARYLASIGPAGRGTANSGYPGGVAPGSPGSTPIPGSPDYTVPQIDKGGGVSAAPPPVAAGAASNPLGHELPSQSFDYSTDPVLQQMLAGGAQDETDAEAQALGARRSVLGQYGDRNLAASVLGEGDPTLGAISDNPDTSTSTIARLKRGYASTVHDSEEAMNANNLFYGGARIKHLGDLARDEQTQEADANSAVHNALDQIGAALGAQRAGIRSSRGAAESDAATRAAQAAMIAALAGGGGAGAGAGGGAGAAPADAAQTSGSATPSGGGSIPYTPTLPGGGALTPGGLGTVQAPPAVDLNDPALKARLAALGLG